MGTSQKSVEEGHGVGRVVVNDSGRNWGLARPLEAVLDGGKGTLDT